MPWIRPDGTFYYGDNQGDIPATSPPPGPGIIAVVEDGVHTGWVPDPAAPLPEPQIGLFTTAMATCPECELWYEQLSPFVRDTLMMAFNNDNPSLELIQFLLDRAISQVAPSEELVTIWETAGFEYKINTPEVTRIRFTLPED